MTSLDLKAFKKKTLKFNIRKPSFMVSSNYRPPGPITSSFIVEFEELIDCYEMNLISQHPVRHLRGFQRTWLEDKNSSPSGGRNRVSWTSSTRHLPNSLTRSHAHIIIPQTPLHHNHKRSDILRSSSHNIQHLSWSTSTLNPGYSSPSPQKHQLGHLRDGSPLWLRRAPVMWLRRQRLRYSPQQKVRDTPRQTRPY